METYLIYGAIAFGLLYLFRKSNAQNKVNSNINATKDVINNIPDNYCIFPGDDAIVGPGFYVHGVHHRRKAVIEWAKGDNHQLTAKREPSNKYDPNAIAIYGISTTGKRKLGYIDAETAEVLNEAGLAKDIKLAITRVEITDKVSKEEKERGFDLKILIGYNIYVPCDKLKEAKGVLEEQNFI